MAYTELRKLYYKNEKQYKQTYLQRFTDENTILLDFFVGGKQAFIYHCPEVYNTMFSILKLDKEISELCNELPGKALEQYSRKCLIDEIVLTNNIEGVYSSRKEINDALSVLEEQSIQKGKRPRFIGLVNKYLKLLSREPVALSTCEDIRSLYDEIVLDEVIAENKNNAPDGKIFRKDQATIRSATDKVVHEGITPESKIIEHMEKALAFLNNKSIEPLYRFCIFHYMLEYIHPFYDGNGRLGRFIFSYCISETLAPLLSYRISETIKENIKRYYDAFETCNDRHNLGDLTPFLITMLQMIQTAANELKGSLQRKLISWKRYEDLIPSFTASSNMKMGALYSLLIQAALFGEQGVSTKQLLSILQISSNTLKKYLNIVDEQDLLVIFKDGSEKFYRIKLGTLDDILLTN